MPTGFDLYRSYTDEELKRMFEREKQEREKEKARQRGFSKYKKKGGGYYD